MPDDSNGRVTNAILSTKLDHVLEKLDDFQLHAADRELRLRGLENKVGRVEERQGILAVGNGVFSTMAAVVAGWFGART